MAKLYFYGAAKGVTGSNYLLETVDTKLLVDCGMFQGQPEEEKRNSAPFPYDQQQIPYLFLTHSHLDHVGRVPLLIKRGFKGKIITTAATRDLAILIWEDLLKIAAGNYRDFLFDEADVQKAIKLIEVVDYGQVVWLSDLTSAILHQAGHILGSAIIEIDIKEPAKKTPKRVFFSGDLGWPPSALLPSFEKLTKADYVVVDAVYGDKVHEDKLQRVAKLEDIIEEVYTKKGVLMIPSFALERTQELLFDLNSLVENNRIPRLPIFLDGPLSTKALGVFMRYEHQMNAQVAQMVKGGDNVFNFPGLKITRSVPESKAINNVPAPKIIIAGSGMSTGGRILHHEMRYLSDPNNSLLLISFQVPGTLGRQLQNGVKSVSINGSIIPVRASIKSLGGYSAHADQPAILDWLSGAKKGLKKVFLVQSDAGAAQVLKHAIEGKLGIPAEIPALNEVAEL